MEKVRENNQPDAEGNRTGIEASIDRALEEMPDGFMIKEFLMANRAEVKDMCLTEYNEEEVMEMFREEGREEERANTERERKRADDLKAELEKYRTRYGSL